jgi:photosystem II stability/assembly factor-like uncharacterized protein
MSDNLESSLSNINLDFTNIKINDSYETPLSGNWGAIKISGNALYQIACQTSGTGQVFISSNYGLNWKVVQYLTDKNLLGSFAGVGISKDGKHMTAIQKNGYVAISNDYGITWSIIKNCVTNQNSTYTILNMAKNWYGIDISGTGQYQTAVSLVDDPYHGGYIYRSNDYGQSWTDVTPYNSPVPRFYDNIAISYSGKYQTVVITANNTPDGTFYPSSMLTSTDYGVTWNKPVQVGYNLVTCCVNSSPDSSIDGKYQYANEYGGEGIFASYDYGVTWMNVLADSNPWICVTTSENGQYIYNSTNLDFVGISNDYGRTWQTKNFEYDLSNVTISSDGSYIAVTTDHDQILFSNDYGVTFSNANDSPILKNIYPVQISSSGQYQTSAINNDQIIISDNYGKTWTKVSIVSSWYGNAISLTGQYQSAIDSNGNIYISNNFGNSWTFSAQFNIGLFGGIRISGDGKYHTIVNGTTTVPGTPALCISDDYGVTWKYVFIEDVRNLSGCAMSVSGKYQTVADNSGVNFGGGQIYISSDYGNTFKQSNIGGGQYFWIYCSMSANGKYQLACNSQSPFIYAKSDDYGETWLVKPQVDDRIITINNCLVSSTGQYQFISMFVNTFQYLIYYSIDYGNTWAIMNTSSINYSCQIASVSSTGQSIVLSDQNSIYQIYLNNLVK